MIINPRETPYNLVLPEQKGNYTGYHAIVLRIGEEGFEILASDDNFKIDNDYNLTVNFNIELPSAFHAIYVIPKNVDVLKALHDSLLQPWFAPAGTRRGVILQEPENGV